MAEDIKEKRSFSESKVTLINRANLAVTGVEKVVSATNNVVNLIVSGSPMCVEGTNLYVAKLDIDQGIIVVEGTVNAIKYGSQKKGPLFKRILK